MDDRVIRVDRDCVNAILRRAELRTPNMVQDETSVVIPKPVHDRLLKESKDYHSLRQALLKAGFSSEELDTFTRGKHDSGQVGLTHKRSLFENETRTAKRLSSANPEKSHWDDNEQEHAKFRPKNTLSWRKKPPGGRALVLSHLLEKAAPKEPPVDRTLFRSNSPETATRKEPTVALTLNLSNLPETATLKDLTNVIQGGRIIEIISKNRRTATVTFAEGAVEFLAYSKRNNICIGSKRIHVSWSDRRFTVASQLQYKLDHGHSRNLVIRGALGKVTEEQLREDMEHIHNLVIIAIVWEDQDVYVSTNSVDFASFARSCMMSRLRYKGLFIEWYPDECADKIPEPTLKPAQLNRQPSGVLDKPKNSVPNRFGLLSLGDGSATANNSGLNTK